MRAVFVLFVVPAVVGVGAGCGGSSADSRTAAAVSPQAKATPHAPAAATPEPATQAGAPDSAPAKTASTESTPDTAPAQQTHAAELALAQDCVAEDKLCLPPRETVTRLCSSKHPDLPIFIFEKHSRWTRGYIRMKEVDAVNTLGGPSGDTKLVFAEEVAILRHRSGSAGNAMAVSGSGGYEVLRWDGTCATLSEEELVTWMPALPQNAPINWKYLDPSIQEALLVDKQIRAARLEHKKECRGASVGSLGPACEHAVKKLNDSIVAAVRSGIELPHVEPAP